MSRKTLEHTVMKAAETVVGQRTIEFYLLAFADPSTGMPDKQGDVISPSAADEWLRNFYAKGKPLPISFTHAAMIRPEDPLNIIGEAPADPQHVWKDAHGIRVIANIDVESNPIAAQVHSLTARGIVNDASVAYFTTIGDQHVRADGATVVDRIDEIMEGGPCLDGANDGAFILAVKAREATTKATLDESAWDANRAMGQCDTAADYQSICAGERSEGEPDQRQHWALPHHYLGQAANAAGVRAARARFNQTEGLTNQGAARTHLFETHRLPSDETQASHDHDDLTLKQLEYLESTFVSMKAGRVISAANLAKLRAAQEVINELLAFGESELAPEQKANANGEEPQANPDERGPDAELRLRLAAFTG